MDFSRTCYTTKARLHASLDAPLVDVLWYFTDLPFLDETLAFNNRLWDSDDLRTLAPGEVFPIAKKFHKPITFGGLNGEHQCGEPGDFTNGQPWPYTGPPIAYDPDGIPACCDRRFGWGPTAGVMPRGIVSAELVEVGRVTAGVMPRGIVSAELVEVGRVTAGVMPRGIVSAELVEVGPVTAGVMPRGDVSVIYNPPSPATAGAMPRGDVRLYCPTYQTVVTEGTGNFFIGVPTDLDSRWIAGIPVVGPSQNAWDLRSPHNAGVNTPGTWLLRKITSPNARTYIATAWNGRGSATFTRTTSPFDTVTVTCSS